MRNALGNGLKAHGRDRTALRFQLLEASHLTSVALAAPMSTARVCSSAQNRKRDIHRRLRANRANGIVLNLDAGGERINIGALALGDVNIGADQTLRVTVTVIEY